MHADTVEAAIDLVNRSAYGNMACLFTSSGAAARQFRYEARVGNVGINVGVAAPMAYFPFSGLEGQLLRRPARAGPRRHRLLHREEGRRRALAVDLEPEVLMRQRGGRWRHSPRSVALLIPDGPAPSRTPPPRRPLSGLSLVAPPGTELGIGDEPLDAAISPDQNASRVRGHAASAPGRRAAPGRDVTAVAPAPRRRTRRADRRNRRRPAAGMEANGQHPFIFRGRTSQAADATVGGNRIRRRRSETRPVPRGCATARCCSSQITVQSADYSTAASRDATRLTPGDVAHLFPVALASSQDFVYVSVRNDGRRVVRLSANGAEIDMGPTSGHAALMGPAPGWLLFVRDGTLLADQRSADGSMAGRDAPVALEVGETRAGRGLFAATADVLFHAKGLDRPRRLVWLDMSGVRLGTAADEGEYSQVRLSPDDTRAAVTTREPLLRTLDVLMVPLTGASPSMRLTTALAADSDPAWSEDGRQIVFRSMRRGRPEVFAIRASTTPADDDGARSVSTDGELPTDWRAAQMLIQRRNNGGFDVVRVNEATGEATPIADTPFNETDARWSPDGRWIAFVSDEPGRPDIYVATHSGEKRRVSLAGGTHPRWTRDGTALLFLRGSMLMRVAARHQAIDSNRPSHCLSCRAFGISMSRTAASEYWRSCPSGPSRWKRCR